ncbi:MAG: hypothetical protein KKF68_00360 [Nanoarchaeota archaeon]|nr:hypothetical protein [Nanoarchaeota archaeon]
MLFTEEELVRLGMSIRNIFESRQRISSSSTDKEKLELMEFLRQYTRQYSEEFRNKIGLREDLIYNRLLKE